MRRPPLHVANGSRVNIVMDAENEIALGYLADAK